MAREPIHTRENEPDDTNKHDEAAEDLELKDRRKNQQTYAFVECMVAARARYWCGGKSGCCRRRRSVARRGGITKTVSPSARVSTTSARASNPAHGLGADSRHSVSTPVRRSVSSSWRRCSPAPCTLSPQRRWDGRGERTPSPATTSRSPPQKASACCGRSVGRPRKAKSLERIGLPCWQPWRTWMRTPRCRGAALTASSRSAPAGSPRP